MNTEIKKNKTMVLALAVIVALAMVSVAGIALQSDDSDAAGTYVPLVEVPSAPFVIDETSTVSYDFYVNEGAALGALLIVVTENANYSGTLRIGTLAGGVYTPYASIELKNAKAAQLTAIAADVGETVAFFGIGNIDKAVGGTLPAGTYELKQGQIILGSVTSGLAGNVFGAIVANYADPAVVAALADSAVSFSGKITAGGFSVTSSYVVGTIIALDSAGKARISGGAVSPNEVLPYNTTTHAYPAFSARTLLLEGSASIQFPEVIQRVLDRNLSTLGNDANVAQLKTILGLSSLPSLDVLVTDSVNVTVAADAVITSGDRAATVASSVTFETVETITGAFLIGSNGSVYEATSLTSPVKFEYVPFGTYTLVAYTATDVWYSTNATVSASNFAFGSNVLTSTFATAVVSDAAPAANPGTFGFKAADYNFVFAFDATAKKKVDAKTVATKVGGSDADVISFPDLGTSNNVFVVLKARVAGAPTAVFNGVNGNTTNAANGLLSATAAATPAAKEIKAVTPASAGAVSAYIALDDSNIAVRGEANFLYNSPSVYGVLLISPGNAKLAFEGTGIVSQGVLPSTQPTAPAGIIGSTNLSAAYYFVNEGSPINKSTYYFTSLTNGIANNNVITLLGKHVILVDTTLDNPAFDTIEIHLGPDASLEVGRVDNPNTDENEGASPVLTVPPKTTIIVPSDADHYEVVSGQAVYDVKPATADEPDADILIEGSKLIYTDLATALEISVSGDVLELQRDATLNRDATVKTGVELKDTGKELTIPAEVTLTVAGKLTSTGTTLINGTIRINSNATFSNSAAATFGPSGAIDVATSGLLTVDDATITGTIANGAITVAGEAIVRNGSSVSAKAITVVGKVTVSSNSYLTAFDKLVIGAEPDLSPLSATYTNAANITGKITLGDDAVAYVYGSASYASKLDSTNQVVSTAYFIDGKLYVTLYTDSASGLKLPVLYENQLKDITIKGWNNEPYLRGSWLAADTREIGENEWKSVYADWEWKQFDVTLHYTQGLQWVVDGNAVSGTIKVNYGQNIVVTVHVQPGFEGTPVLKAGSASYTAGAAFKVTDNVTFTATGVQQAGSGNGGGNSGNDGLTLIEILLIIIVIIIAVIAIIVAIRLMRS